tara:strand:- start:388 stop:576 length:189 start_codon:yes stop_codon:yes gene_type:complete
MSVKNEIKEIELIINDLKSSDFEFEAQVENYSIALTKINKLTNRVKELDDQIKTIQQKNNGV